MVINIELALITPPVGLNLFVLKGVDKSATIALITKGVIPYVIIMILFIIILSFFPELSTWLTTEVK